MYKVVGKVMLLISYHGFYLIKHECGHETQQLVQSMRGCS